VIWEAADIQWWWRQERASDRDGHLFWLDENGEPLAAAIRTGAASKPAEFPVRADDTIGAAELAAAGSGP
jgi:hypothetical protein